MENQNLIPTKYYIQDALPRNQCHIGPTGVTIEARNWKNGVITAWAVCDYGSCLDKITGEFEYEGMNSSRTDEYIQRTRYPTLEEAYADYLKWRAVAVTKAVKRIVWWDHHYGNDPTKIKREYKDPKCKHWYVWLKYATPEDLKLLEMPYDPAVHGDKNE